MPACLAEPAGNENEWTWDFGSAGRSTRAASASTRLAIRQGQREQLHRVQVTLVPHHFKMKMRPGHSPCSARQSNLCVLPHAFTAVHRHLLQVHVHREQAVAMIDEDAVALIKQRSG